MNRCLVIGILLFTAVTVQSVELPRHYIDLEAGMGVGSLGYELKGGKTLLTPSFTFGAGYTWFFLPSVGVHTGVDVSRTASLAMLTDVMEWSTWPDGTGLTDYMGEAYTHRTHFSDWREKQQVWFLQVPVGLRFRQYAPVSRQNSAFSRFGLQAGAGILLSMPVRANYHHTSGELVHSGWYEQWHLLLHDIPGRFETEPFTAQREPISGSLKRFVLSVYAETGLLVRPDERTELSFLLYVQWMPQDVLSVRSDECPSLGFASEANGYTFMYVYHGLIGTSQTTALHPWCTGLKICLSLYPGKTAAEKKRCMCDW